MGAFTYESFLNKTISDQRREISSYIFLVIAVVVLGLSIIALGIFSPPAVFKHFQNPADVAKWSFGLGGSFVTAMFGYSFKEVRGRVKHLNMFSNIRNQLANVENLPKAERAKIKKRLEDLMWKYIEQELLN